MPFRCLLDAARPSEDGQRPVEPWWHQSRRVEVRPDAGLQEASWLREGRLWVPLEEDRLRSVAGGLQEVPEEPPGEWEPKVVVEPKVPLWRQPQESRTWCSVTVVASEPGEA